MQICISKTGKLKIKVNYNEIGPYYHYLPNSFGSVCIILFNFGFEIWYLVWI